MPYVNKAVNNALSAAPRFAHNVVMLSTNHRSIRVAVALLAAAAIPAFAQSDFKAAALKHLKTSKDFTLKVANQMPESSYDFKLTPPQMSFSEQMVHLPQSMPGIFRIADLRREREPGQAGLDEEGGHHRVYGQIV